jgi:hypothetical protein
LCNMVYNGVTLQKHGVKYLLQWCKVHF